MATKVIDFEEILEEKGTKVCSICAEKFVGFGNNPQLVFNLKVENRCCDECNARVVLPRRIREARKEKNNA